MIVENLLMRFLYLIASQQLLRQNNNAYSSFLITDNLYRNREDNLISIDWTLFSDNLF